MFLRLKKMQQWKNNLFFALSVSFLLLFVFALFFALFERLISCGAFLLALFFNTFFERWTRTGFHKIHQDLSTRNILWRVYYFIIWFTKVVFVPKEDGVGDSHGFSPYPISPGPWSLTTQRAKKRQFLGEEKHVSPLVKVNELREKNGLFGLYVDLYREFYYPVIVKIVVVPGGNPH